MKSTLSAKHTAGLSVLSTALLTFGWGCSSEPASSGGLHEFGTGGATSTGQAGTGTSVGGTGVVTTGGSSGSSSIAGTSGSFAGTTSTGGSGTAAGGTAAGGTAAGGTGTATGGMGGTGTTAGGGTVGPSGGSAGMGGPSLCPVAGTTLCDGFEGAAPGAAGSDWTTIVTGGTMTVDTTKFYRGTKSMHYSGTSKTYLVEKKTFAGTTKATNNAFWARYFVLSGVAAVTDYGQAHAVFGTLADAADASDPNRFHFVGGSRAKLEAEIRITGDSYTDDMKAPGAGDPSFPIASQGWQCWEFHVQPDDSFDFYINGTEVMEMQIVAGKAKMSGASFSPLPVFGQLQIGWQYFGTSMASGWIDEVAIGPNRIPCDQ